MSNTEHYQSNGRIGLLFALVANAFAWGSDVLNSPEFSAVLRALGFISVVLAIANTLGMLDGVKRKLRSVLGITKGKQ